MPHYSDVFVFFFNDTATTEIYTLSLHDALPIWTICTFESALPPFGSELSHRNRQDRKSTRLNSSHLAISYAVFCLKKKHTTNLALLSLRCGRSRASFTCGSTC